MSHPNFVMLVVGSIWVAAIVCATILFLHDQYFCGLTILIGPLFISVRTESKGRP